VTPAELIALSNERDKWMARIDAAGREGYHAGFADGQAAERRRADAEWAAQPPPAFDPDAPTLAELELRRWGPGGRLRFADPRPGDRLAPAPLTASEDDRVPA
jgi:hypothetical protein